MLFGILLFVASLAAVETESPKAVKIQSLPWKRYAKMRRGAWWGRPRYYPKIAPKIAPKVDLEKVSFDAEDLENGWFKKIWKVVKKVAPIVAKVAPLVLAEDEQAELAEMNFDAEELDDSFWKKLGSWARKAVDIAGKVASIGGKIFGDDELATLEELSEMNFDGEDVEDAKPKFSWKKYLNKHQYPHHRCRTRMCGMHLINIPKDLNATIFDAEDAEDTILMPKKFWMRRPHWKPIVYKKPIVSVPKMVYDAEDLENGWFKKIWKVVKKVAPIVAKVAPLVLAEDEQAELAEMNFDAEELDDSFWKKLGSWARKAVDIAGKVASIGGKIFGDDELATLEELSEMNFDGEDLENCGGSKHIWCKTFKNKRTDLKKFLSTIKSPMSYDADELENGWFKKMFKKIVNIGKKVIPIASKVYKFGSKILGEDEVAALADELESLENMSFDAEDLEDGWLKNMWRKIRNIGEKVVKIAGQVANIGGKILSEDEMETLEELQSMSFDAEELDDSFWSSAWKIIKTVGPVAAAVLADDEESAMTYDAEDLENGWFKKMWGKIKRFGQKVVNVAGTIAEYGGKILSEDELAALESLESISFDADELENGWFKKLWGKIKSAAPTIIKYGKMLLSEDEIAALESLESAEFDAEELDDSFWSSAWKFIKHAAPVVAPLIL